MKFSGITPLDLARLRVHPLANRVSLTKSDEILVEPQSEPATVGGALAEQIALAAQAIRKAKARGACVMLIYGAHLLRNGAALLLERLMAGGWLTHVATNGAGTIHDWEYAWLGASTEGVEVNVAQGTFGCWDETGKYLHMALMAGALDGLGYGCSLGRFISEGTLDLPKASELEALIVSAPRDPMTPARADLLSAILSHGWPEERLSMEHHWKHCSILGAAWRHGVPATVHPGIGYDIISNHPAFNGAALGRAAEIDFKLFGGSVENLEGGVVLSVGSAIMGPQVFEKSLSCVNNLRIQAGLSPVAGHSIFVVDLQDGGGWDWSLGEPPKSNAAYYLRFCKSFSRMGAPMHYLQCDNVAFVHHLWKALDGDSDAGLK